MLTTEQNTSDESAVESDITDYDDVDYISVTKESSSDESDASLSLWPKRHLIGQRYPSLSTEKRTPSKSDSVVINVLSPSNSKDHRVYDKRNYCLFCLKPASKISRHLETVHHNETEVTRAVQHPKN
ncbi:hypothetical protein AAFF_G00070490 [Aldrovandia affinis]|uniref:Uncharacterized protein n=1 Tax=Aldrovandia affinis TaxID=143900 RepID=A0AAD7RYV0_9TELE|nr:hypothetical protein AAFF_G00070490 [Aldrovandia affinis]